MRKQIIIYAKPMISCAPDNWDIMNEKEKISYCKKLVENNSGPEYDKFFDLKKDSKGLEKMCQLI